MLKFLFSVRMCSYSACVIKNSAEQILKGESQQTTLTGVSQFRSAFLPCPPVLTLSVPSHVPCVNVTLRLLHVSPSVWNLPPPHLRFHLTPFQLLGLKPGISTSGVLPMTPQY